MFSVSLHVIFSELLQTMSTIENNNTGNVFWTDKFEICVSRTEKLFDNYSKIKLFRKTFTEPFSKALTLKNIQILSWCGKTMPILWTLFHLDGWSVHFNCTLLSGRHLWYRINGRFEKIESQSFLAIPLIF